MRFNSAFGGLKLQLKTLSCTQDGHKAYLLTSAVSFAHLKQDKNVHKYKKKKPERNMVERSNTRLKEGAERVTLALTSKDALHFAHTLYNLRVPYASENKQRLHTPSELNYFGFVMEQCFQYC